MTISKHKISSLIFTIVFIVELLFVWFDKITLSVLLITIVFYSGVLALGSYYLRFQYYLPSTNRLKGTKKVITLTFDDGPNKNVTPRLLEILEKHNVKGMFFCIGNKIQDNICLAKELVNQGHILGNHSYSHSNCFALFSYKKVAQEIDQTNELIESITLQKNIYFRPPFGVTNPIIAKVVNSKKMKVVGWSLRSLDTVSSPSKLLNNLKKWVKPNNIILMHELESSLHVVDEFIKHAKQEGYEFVLPEIER